MPLDSAVSLGVRGTLSKALDLAISTSPLLRSYGVSLLTGTGTGQADRIFHDQRTLAASANEDLDLAGVLIDPLGDPLTFVKVRAFIVAAAAGNSNNVIVGGATTNGFITWVGAATHTVTVRPGGAIALFAGVGDATGYAVTAGTGDLLRVANGGAGTPVTYDVIVIGTSA